MNKNNIIIFLVSIITILFVYNNYFLYKTPILKITNIKEEKISNTDSKEIYYEQEIEGIIKNGKYKGNILKTHNRTSTSGVYDEQIKKHTELLVELSEDGESILSISGIKRDKYIAILLVLFISLMIIVGEKNGFKTLISLLINIIMSLFVIFIYQEYLNHINILLLFIPLSFIFITLSLLITNDKSKKTLSAIISSIISLLVSFTLSYILMLIYKDEIPFWFMDYIEAAKDYENIFYVNILLCGLGAIMDIGITMASSINELLFKNPKMSLKSLKKSGKEISKDVVGTMVNVMLFTMFSSIIPFAFLVTRNNIPLHQVLSSVGEIEMIRILCAAISIVFAIPISLYTSIYILKGGKK